ncbi:MAG: hypothetical protein FD141_1560 [Fusobacteria bacterium]|nr:MAG: hypothetical protein FD141_1560 [Fusobacteriota bacterium]KAF0230273.1 MAG: hypothetical protein FD182_663 [Fusobacteriota bacterium]
MKKNKIFISLGLILLGSLLIVIAFAFGGEDKKIDIDDGSYSEPIGTDSGVIKNSSTTGLAFDGDYKPVMAVIENSPDARPQIGLQTADVVYEVMVEGSVTRFVSIFSDKVPEQILPIRSGRAPFLYIQQEWDGLFMHFGASGHGVSNPSDYTFYGNKLYKDIKQDLDGLTGNKDGIFKRVNTAPAPHNVMGNPLLAQKLYKYDPKPLDWKFDAAVFYPGESVIAVELPFTTSIRNFVSYTYDFNKGVYLRSMSGVPFIAAETKAQLEVKNVIVQYTSYSIKGSVYKDWVMVGSGRADFYIGGMYVQGSWSKESPTAQTMYKDAVGNPIVLKPGNTWIHINPNK